MFPTHVGRLAIFDDYLFCGDVGSGSFGKARAQQFPLWKAPGKPRGSRYIMIESGLKSHGSIFWILGQTSSGFSGKEANSFQSHDGMRYWKQPVYVVDGDSSDLAWSLVSQRPLLTTAQSSWICCQVSSQVLGLPPGRS